MIKLTDEQAEQIDRNISAAIEDLNTAAFESSDQTPLICTGAYIGQALQKLHDIRQFLADEASKEFAKELKFHKKPLGKQKLENDDPWEEDDFKATVDSHLRQMFGRGDRDC